MILNYGRALNPIWWIKRNKIVTGEEIIKDDKGQEVSLRQLFKNKIEGNKKQVREKKKRTNQDWLGTFDA